jgi:hypothetical protein
MITTSHVAPPNSLLLITDRETGDIPESLDNGIIAATETCIAIGTLSAADGETTVFLTDDRATLEGHQDLHRVFTGMLATPSTEVHVQTVLLEPVAMLPVERAVNHVEVWVNDDAEPSIVYVLVDASDLASK